MTTPTTVLSEHTEADIADAAPCQVAGAIYGDLDGQPARWIARLTGQLSDRVVTVTTLACDDHAEAIRRHNTACSACREFVTVELELINRRPW